MLLVLHVFGHKIKILDMSKFELNMALNKKGDMNVYMKVNGDPSYCCQDVSLKNTHFSLIIAQEEKSCGHQSR